MKKYYALETNQDTRTAELYIFGDIVDATETGIADLFGIDMGETSSLSIVKDIQSLDVDTINVHINSMGGYVNEGLAIYNVLKNSSATVNTIVDGFACSSASVIFMAGEKRTMNSASVLMIHNAWMQPDAGNSAQLRQYANELDQISQAAGNAYMERVSISRPELDAMLDGENHEGSWILPADAVKMGFATDVADASAKGVPNQSAMRQVLAKVAAKAPSVGDITVQLHADINPLAQQIQRLADMFEKPLAALAEKGDTQTAKTNAERLMAALKAKKEGK